MRIHVIINPVAGQDQPVLSLMNRAFHPSGVDWEVRVTKSDGDARRYALEAVEAGVDAVGVYGGDGTVMEVASGLIGTDIPLAIFPGGTANVISVELGIPSDLTEAMALACSEARSIRTIDVGQVDGRYFLLRVGMGFEAQMVAGADRGLKDRIGVLAYGVSAVQALTEPSIARYQIEIDGEHYETEGMTCIVANSASLGQLGLTLASKVDVSDGLLDVLVVRQADLGSLISVAASVVTGTENADRLLHWQGREIRVTAEPPQVVQVDGEVLGEVPITARVVPGAVKVIVPSAVAGDVPSAG